ncbi:MAG: polysaccharide biosynthesis C-terminal domain-containing protein [Bacteroidetes bacterium]|nr:polysaccharide biosynthesis C-terminal domain-containing protein [Bacteroidota bacterium]
MIIKESLYALGLRVVSAALNYAYFFLIPLLFGIEALGEFGLFMAWNMGLAAFLSFGLHIKLLKETSVDIHNSNWQRFYCSSLIFCLVASIVVSLFILWFQKSGIHSQHFSLWLALALPNQVVIMLNTEVLRGLGNIKLSEFFRSTSTFFGAFIILLLAHLMGFSNATASFAFSTSLLITGMISTWLVFSTTKVKWALADKTDFLDQIKASLPIMLATSVQSWNSRVLFILLGFTTNISAVGVFTMMFKLSAVPDFVVSSIKVPVASKIARGFKSGSLQTVAELLQSTAGLITVILVPVCLVFLLMVPIITKFLGKDFDDGSTALYLLIMAQLISALFGLTGLTLNMAGHHNEFLKFSLLGFALNFFIAVMATPRFGISGASSAFILSTITWNFMASAFVYKRYGIATFLTSFRFDKRKILKW